MGKSVNRRTPTVWSTLGIPRFYETCSFFPPGKNGPRYRLFLMRRTSGVAHPGSVCWSIFVSPFPRWCCGPLLSSRRYATFLHLQRLELIAVRIESGPGLVRYKCWEPRSQAGPFIGWPLLHREASSGDGCRVHVHCLVRGVVCCLNPSGIWPARLNW